jgi:hypothetical protein
MRTEAESNGASVTTGHPAGLGNRSTIQRGGEETKLRPEVMGSRFWSSSVMVGVP